MSKNFKLCGFIAIIFFSSSVFSAQGRLASISSLMLDTGLGDKLFIEINTNEESSGTCHKNSKWHFVFPINDSLVNKAMQSYLLKAQATNEKLLFVGSGSCNIFNELETLKRIELVN